MPDFVRLSETNSAFLRLSEVTAGRPVRIGPYEVTAFPVEHTVETVGYRIDDGSAVVAVFGDTAPVPTVFAEVARMPRLAAVFLEASFPDSLANIAAASRHLTASQFVEAARLFPPTVAVYAVHIKPRFAEAIASTIQAAALPNVHIARPGQTVSI